MRIINLIIKTFIVMLGFLLIGFSVVFAEKIVFSVLNIERAELSIHVKLEGKQEQQESVDTTELFWSIELRDEKPQKAYLTVISVDTQVKTSISGMIKSSLGEVQALVSFEPKSVESFTLTHDF